MIGGAGRLCREGKIDRNAGRRACVAGGVVAQAALDGVRPRPADKDVVAVAAIERIGAAQAFKPVGADGPCYRVRSGGTHRILKVERGLDCGRADFDRARGKVDDLRGRCIGPGDERLVDGIDTVAAVVIVEFGSAVDDVIARAAAQCICARPALDYVGRSRAGDGINAGRAVDRRDPVDRYRAEVEGDGGAGVEVDHHPGLAVAGYPLDAG